MIGNRLGSYEVLAKLGEAGIGAVLACLAALGVALGAQPSSAPYFPERFDWQRRTPAELGMDSGRLDEAIAYAIANESKEPRDQRLAHAAGGNGSEPFGDIIGPMSDRGDPTGVVIRRGFVMAQWGEPGRVEMTHSVSKTFLTTVVGLAVQAGRIRDVHHTVRQYMPSHVDLFDAPHNQPITWDHLLRQTSDWQGTLWGKPDWADRPEGAPREWANPPRHPPGTRFEYNDVRVNVLALAALHVLRRPLPQVLREEIMDPIGASSTWRWHGYANSWVEVDGSRMQSVSGGGHWGGGMFINTWDMARFGYLFLRNGKWKDRQLVSERWIQMAKTPGTANPEYGYANWYLDATMPAAPKGSVRFSGGGDNHIYIDWQNELVVVVRWLDRGAFRGLVEKLMASVKPQL